MKLSHVLFAGLVALVLALPSAAQAQATKIFVASTGNDANDGSRGAPKRNFQAAHDAVAAGGQIVVLDTAGYGALSITKSVSVTVPPGVNGFVTVTTGNGITINAGANDSVALRGLIVEGSGSDPFSSGYGIVAFNVGNLAVEDCTVRNFGIGIYMRSNTAAKGYVHRCVARGCGYGLDVQAGSATAHSTIATDCRFEQNVNYGVLAAISNVGGKVDLTVADCIVAGTTGAPNAAGILSQSISGAQIDAAVVRVDNCCITDNSFGVGATNGGQVLSRVNNTLEHNTNGDTFPGTVLGTYSAK